MMKELELAIKFLKNRAIDSDKLNSKLFRHELVSVLPASEVSAVLEMVLNGEFSEFYDKQKEAGNKACS